MPYLVSVCFLKWVVVAHALNPSTWTWEEEAGGSQGLRPAWCTELVPGTPKTTQRDLSSKTKTKKCQNFFSFLFCFFLFVFALVDWFGLDCFGFFFFFLFLCLFFETGFLLYNLSYPGTHSQSVFKSRGPPASAS